jgi:transposase-like protein
MPRGRLLKERLDKATLIRLYEGAGLSIATIAQRYGSHTSNVSRLMDEYGIARRPRGAGTT